MSETYVIQQRKLATIEAPLSLRFSVSSTVTAPPQQPNHLSKRRPSALNQITSALRYPFTCLGTASTLFTWIFLLTRSGQLWKPQVLLPFIVYTAIAFIALELTAITCAFILVSYKPIGLWFLLSCSATVLGLGYYTKR